MRRFHLRHQIAVAIILLALFTGIGAACWFCQTRDSVAFLPLRPGAEWIIDAVPPKIIEHPTTPVKDVFRCRFALSHLPTNAVLTFCAFKNAEIQINGRTIIIHGGNGENWKSLKTAVVTDRLRAGTNEIAAWVTNSAGPPALWLRLRAENFSLSSGEHWQVSLTGTFWNPAHLASRPVSIPRWSAIYDGTSTFSAVKKTWRTLAWLLAFALGIILVVERQFSDGTNFKAKLPAKLPPIYLLLAIILIARTVLFINEAPNLPGWVSFDEPAHLAYTKYIQDNGKLPPPDGGSEMHQPPLHYLISAAVSKLCGNSLTNTDATIPLRAVNGVVGLLQCWLALLCLRLIFPNNFSAQAVGLLLAAFLPPQIYLSIGITNDPLTELSVTAAFYFLLRILRSEKETLWLHVALGFTLGAAMLSKLSALPAVLIFFLTLFLHSFQRQKTSARDWFRRVGTVALICFAVSGWHYLRVALHTNAIIAIPRSEGGSWWQTPGFRTAGFYLSFGQVLIHPLFGGLNSFADGIYSTLWGDGMISGATGFIFRPPWNYDLMKAGYLLALPLSMLAFAGFGIALQKSIRERRLEWFFIAATVFIYLLALVAITLLGPWQSQVKAFYAMPAFVPFCALIAAGWNRLAKKNRAWQTGLWILILVWSLTVFTSFWISDHRAETWRSRAIEQIRQKNFSEAVNDALISLKLNPNDYDAHCLLAQALTSQKKTNEAVQQYLAALQINSDSPQILDMFALMMIGEDKAAAQRAVGFAERACELTGHRNDEMLTTLAKAYANNGQISQALATAKAAGELAQATGSADLLKQDQELIEHHRQTEPQPSHRTGAEPKKF